MKKIITICLLFITTIGYCQEIDTLYFDKNCKAVANKLFADSYMVTLSDGSSNLFRTFTIDGKLIGQGSYISLNKQDYRQSVFDGEHTEYYPNGNYKCVRNYINGIKNGKQIDYGENGKVQSADYYTNGELTLSQTYYENGNLRSEVKMYKGQEHGPYKEFDKDSGYPIVFAEFDNGLPVGVYENRSGGLTKEIYKEVKLSESDSIRLSCTTFKKSIPIKETGQLLALMGAPTGMKYKTIMAFELQLKNDANSEGRVYIENVKVEYKTKGKLSKNLVYTESDAVKIFETSATQSVNKAYSDAAYVANVAATQSTTSTNNNSSYNSTSINGQTTANTSNRAAAVGATYAGALAANNSGDSAVAIGGSVSGVVGASTSNASVTTSGTVTDTSHAYGSNTTSHTDGGVLYSVYNEESKKAEMRASELESALIEITSDLRYSNVQIEPNSRLMKCIIADVPKKYDSVTISFSVNGTLCEVEFTNQEVEGAF